MKWRIVQLVLCIIIWGIIIGVGLFKLNPIMSVSNTLTAIQSRYNDYENKRVTAHKTRPQSGNVSRKSNSSRITADYAMPGHVRSRNRKRGYSSRQKRLVVVGTAKRKKIDQLMYLLHDLSDEGELGIQEVIKLIEQELIIIRNLLRHSNARVIKQAVEKRDALLELSLPTVIEVYDMTLDLASVRSRKNESNNRTVFLRNMMERLEHYYRLIKSMQDTFRTVPR